MESVAVGSRTGSLHCTGATIPQCGQPLDTPATAATESERLDRVTKP